MFRRAADKAEVKQLPEINARNSNWKIAEKWMNNIKNPYFLQSD